MTDITGVVKLNPVPSNVPPDAASYQLIVSPALTAAETVTVPLPHLAPLTAFIGAAGNGFMIAVTGVLVADTHPVVVFFVSA